MSNFVNQVAEPQTSKRMRLGTKSCAECRRRRVRCVFDRGSQACQNCISHQTQCRAQQPKGASSYGDTESGSSFQKRLEELERAIRRMSEDAVPPTNFADPNRDRVNPAQALQLLSPPQSVSAASEVHAATTDARDSSDEGQVIEDAPLVNLLKQVMVIQGPTEQNERDGLTLVDPRSVVEALRALLPGPNDLTSIFENTEPYWLVWWHTPLFPIPESRPGSSQSPAKAARDFMLESMRSDNLTIVAKAATWLALNLQQLTSKAKSLHIDLPAPLNTILASYVRGAGILVAREEDGRAGTQSVECLLLYGRLCIDMGRPRKAWLSVRRAINYAILQGMHRVRASRLAHALWSRAWMLDRQLCLVLGHPPAVPEAYLKTPIPNHGAEVPLYARIMRQEALIAGHISERNHLGEDADYSITLQIEQALINCRNEAPEEWWNLTGSQHTSLSELFYHGFVKSYYYQLWKMLHEPYMLKGFTDGRYEHSRTACLTACREIIKAYNALRSFNQSTNVMCDLLDFETFSAALVLTISLLSRQEPHRDPDEQAEDWAMVRELTTRFRILSQAMECAVANQASNLLEYLYLAGHGLYGGMKDYDAVIPYFGRLRISQGPIKTAAAATATATTTTTTTLTRITTPTLSTSAQSYAPSTTDGTSETQFPSSTQTSTETAKAAPGNTVEISADYFTSFHPPSFDMSSSSMHKSDPDDTLADMELGMDWTAMFDLESTYDWTYLFDNPMQEIDP